jgi:general L-amino acid transport system substrate-binding protein
VRRGDAEWFAIVKWVVYATINAEEFGVTSQNVDQMKGSPNPNIKRLLGTADQMGDKLGISNDWAYNIIKQVGNYGEIFERNVGLKSPLKLERGLNALAEHGGLMYGMPIR